MFRLIDLPYAPDALEPVISARTLAFHHGKHLQAYVDNLNKLLPGTGLEDQTLEQIVRQATGAVFNNAGQILNHNLYFTQFRAPQPAGPVPESPLTARIRQQWGTLEDFQADFEAKGASLFGSGWVRLQSAPSSTPAPTTPSPTASAPSSPSTSGNTPTTSTTRTAAPRTSRPSGRSWTGRRWGRDIRL